MTYKRLFGSERQKRVNCLKRQYNYYLSYLKKYNNDLTADKWVIDEINSVIDELRFYGYYYNKF